MTNYAVPRTDYSRLPLADQYTHEYRVNPQFVIPYGYEVDPHVPGRIRQVGSGRTFLDRWGWPIMLGMVGAGTLAGGYLNGAGAAAGAGIGSGEAGSTAAAGSSLFGSPGAASLGSALSGEAGAAAGGAMAFGYDDAAMLALSAMGMLGGRGGNSQPPLNSELSQLLQLQKQRMQLTDPVYRAILQWASGMMPAQYRAGLPTSYGGSIGPHERRTARMDY